MKPLNHLIFCSAILGALSINALAEEFDLNELKSTKARSAVSAYQRNIEAAQKDYAKLVSKERNRLIDELEEALKNETSAGNLEEAVKLKAAIESLKRNADSSSPSKQNQPPVIGLWKLQYSDGAIRYQQFLLRNGQLYARRFREIGGKPYTQGPVEIRNGKALFSYNDNALLERFTSDGDRMFVEQWKIRTEKSIERFPNLFCIATRVKETDE